MRKGREGGVLGIPRVLICALFNVAESRMKNGASNWRGADKRELFYDGENSHWNFLLCSCIYFRVDDAYEFL